MPVSKAGIEKAPGALAAVVEALPAPELTVGFLLRSKFIISVQIAVRLSLSQA